MWFTAVAPNGTCSSISSASEITLKEDGKAVAISALERAADHPMHYILVVDVSGSGRKEISEIQTALDRTMQFLRDHMRADRDQVALVDFNDEVYLDQKLTSDLQQFQAALLKALEFRGGTALFDALDRAGNYARKTPGPARNILLVIADGIDNSSHVSREQAVRAAQSDGVTVVGLHLTETQPHDGKATLQQLASKTGGLVVDAANPRELEASLPKVATLLDCGYLARYPRPASRPGEHRIEIKPVNRGGATILAPEHIADH